MRNFELYISPTGRGSILKIDGQEIKGLTSISFNMLADAEETQPKIILEFDGLKTNEAGDFIPRSLENGLQVLDKFSHKVTVYSASIQGEFNDYPIG